MSTRPLSFEGCYNFRDLGGWRTDDGRTVRYRRLFRADSVHLMTDADAQCARDELGVRTVLDLRNDREIAVGGLGLLADGGISRLHLPLTSRPRQTVAVDSPAAAQSPDRSPDAVVPQYLGILENSSALIVQALSSLAGENSLPAVFFCAAGKDRTGVLSAVLLGALGVTDEGIVEDYMLTSEVIEPIIERFAATPGSPEFYRDLPAAHFAPQRETMERVIEGVRDKYRSFHDYLLAKELGADALDRLTRSLLES